MLRVLCVVLVSGCSLFPDLGGLTSGSVDAGLDAGSEAGSEAGTDAGSDAASCSCTNLVSAYRFSDANNLGHDYFGNNNMTSVSGSPAQSSITPSGMSGHSIQLDGSSTVCIQSGFTFDSTADHTLCFWSRPAALSDSTNQFAQACGYDTWTTNSGVDYLWRINNCDNGTPSDLQVPNVYSVGNWTQICQTYTRASLQRTVMVDGQTSNKHSINDPAPIVEVSSSQWCIGAYGSGGFWTGLIYLPLWFDRVLSDSEIQNVYATGCCLP